MQLGGHLMDAQYQVDQTSVQHATNPMPQDFKGVTAVISDSRKRYSAIDTHGVY